MYLVACKQLELLGAADVTGFFFVVIPSAISKGSKGFTEMVPIKSFT